MEWTLRRTVSTVFGCSTSPNSRRAPFGSRQWATLPNFFRKPYEGGRAQMYDLTCAWRAFEPPPPEMLALYQALRHNSVERDRYFGTLGGTVPIPEFHARENVQRITSTASA